MDIESKCEINNILIRKYRSVSNKMDIFKQIIDFNFDFVAFIIKNDFPEYIGDKTIYALGIMGIIDAIDIYEMDKIGSFEAFIMACIKTRITNFLNEKNMTEKTK